MKFNELEEARQWYESKIAELRKTSYETGIPKCDDLLKEMKSFRIERTVSADDDEDEESWGHEIGSIYSIATAKDIEDLIEEVEHIKDWMTKRSGNGQLNSNIDLIDKAEKIQSSMYSAMGNFLTPGVTSIQNSPSGLVGELPDLIDVYPKSEMVASTRSVSDILNGSELPDLDDDDFSSKPKQRSVEDILNNNELPEVSTDNDFNVQPKRTMEVADGQGVSSEDELPELINITPDISGDNSLPNMDGNLSVDDTKQTSKDKPVLGNKVFYPFIYSDFLPVLDEPISVYIDGTEVKYPADASVCEMLHYIDKDMDKIGGIANFEITDGVITGAEPIFNITYEIWNCMYDEDYERGSNIIKTLEKSNLKSVMENTSYPSEYAKVVADDARHYKEACDKFFESMAASGGDEDAGTRSEEKIALPSSFNNGASWYTGTANLEYFATYFKFVKHGTSWYIVDPEGTEFTLMGDLFVEAGKANISRMEFNSFSDCLVLLPDGSLMNGYAMNKSERYLPTNYMVETAKDLGGVDKLPNYLIENRRTDLYKDLSSVGYSMVPFTQITQTGINPEFVDCRKRCVFNRDENNRPYMFWKGVLTSDDMRDLMTADYIFKPTYDYSPYPYEYEYAKRVLFNQNKDIEELHKQQARQQQMDKVKDVGNMAKDALGKAKGLFSRFKR